jgi:putative nucleotidyltransferase with HDIG domain
VGAAILGALFAWLGLRVARHGYRHRHPKQRDHVFLASALVGFLLFVWMGYKTVDWLAEVEPLGPMGADVYRLLLPVAGVVIVVRLAAGVLVAAAAAPVCALFAGYMMDGDLTFAAYTLAGGLAAAAVEGGAKRMVLSAGLRAGVAQALVAVGASLLDADLELQEAGVRVAGALGSGLLAALLARATLPAVEALFGYTTPTGLAALADAEHPLLRELLVESPGTYHHSLHVGALAEAGAAAIGSDRLLARVGGYFHDVGRLRRAHGEAGPSSEWARGGRLRRSASLAGPGLDGAARVPSPPERRAAAGELASGHRFPPELAQILAEQPHESARDLQPGRPKPRSKASALVFLADWVEDALRGREGSVEDADALEALVREEVRAAVAGRFLDAADLELRELAAVTEAFAAVLGPRFRSSPTDEGAFRVAPPPPGAPS